jgi:ankyrin repeat protein
VIVDGSDFRRITLLYFAPQQNDSDCPARLYIEAGADINMANEDGNAALRFIGCEASHLKIIELLLKTCANVNAKNNDGDTPLTVALDENPRRKMINALLAHGAD